MGKASAGAVIQKQYSISYSQLQKFAGPCPVEIKMEQHVPDPGPESHAGDLLETLDFGEEEADDGSQEEMTEEGDEFNTPTPPLTIGTVLELIPKRKIGNI